MQIFNSKCPQLSEGLMKKKYFPCFVYILNQRKKHIQEKYHVPKHFHHYLLYTDKLMPALEIGFERFEENELDNATIPEQ